MSTPPILGLPGKEIANISNINPATDNISLFEKLKYAVKENVPYFSFSYNNQQFSIRFFLIIHTCSMYSLCNIRKNPFMIKKMKEAKNNSAVSF